MSITASLCPRRIDARPYRPQRPSRTAMAGLSLIELMVAVVLGLLVVLAAIGLFTSNRAVYDSTEALSRIQENARAGFELMARDIRVADGTVCRSPVYQNTAAAASSPEKMPLIRWLSKGNKRWGVLGDWGDGLRGWNEVSGDVIELRSATSGAVSIVKHEPSELTFAGQPRFKEGDELLACDINTGYLLTAIGVRGNSIAYLMPTCEVKPGGGGSLTGGEIGVEDGQVCDEKGPLIEPARHPAFLAPVTAVRWEVGENPRGGRSLYRLTPGASGDDKAEVIDGVRSLKLHYLLPGKTGYVTARQVGNDWKKVRAVRIALELEASPDGGTGNEIGRRIVHVVSLRNRNP